MSPSMKVHVHQVNPMKNKSFSKSWNPEGKGCKAKDSFFDHLGKKKHLMGSKCLTLGVGHMCRK